MRTAIEGLVAQGDTILTNFTIRRGVSIILARRNIDLDALVHGAYFRYWQRTPIKRVQAALIDVLNGHRQRTPPVPDDVPMYYPERNEHDTAESKH